MKIQKMLQLAQFLVVGSRIHFSLAIYFLLLTLTKPCSGVCLCTGTIKVKKEIIHNDSLSFTC